MEIGTIDKESLDLSSLENIENNFWGLGGAGLKSESQAL
jgi:hypothetical protein